MVRKLLTPDGVVVDDKNMSRIAFCDECGYSREPLIEIRVGNEEFKDVCPHCLDGGIKIEAELYDGDVIELEGPDDQPSIRINLPPINSDQSMKHIDDFEEST